MEGWTDGRVESQVARRSDQWSEEGGADGQMRGDGVGGSGGEVDRGEGDGWAEEAGEEAGSR